MEYKNLFHPRPKTFSLQNTITCRTEEYDSFSQLTCHVPESITHTRFGALHNGIYLQLAQNDSFAKPDPYEFLCNSSGDYLKPDCRGKPGYGLGDFNATDWTFNIDYSKIKRPVDHLPLTYRCQVSPPVEDNLSIPCTLDFTRDGYLSSNLTRAFPNSSPTCTMNSSFGNNSVTCHFPNKWPDQFQLQYKEKRESSKAAKPVTYCDTVDTRLKCRFEIPDFGLLATLQPHNATFFLPENMTSGFFSCLLSGGHDSEPALNWCNFDLKTSLYNATSSFGSKISTAFNTTGMATEMTTGMATGMTTGMATGITTGFGLFGLGALGAGLFIGAKTLWNRKRKRDDDSIKYEQDKYGSQHLLSSKRRRTS